MQVAIEIYDELYDIIKREKHEGKHLNIYERAIMDGAILPTHGRLIDADALLEDCWWETEKEVSLAPTVLEASKK